MLLLGFSEKVLLSYTFSNICCFFDLYDFFKACGLTIEMWVALA